MRSRRSRRSSRLGRAPWRLLLASCLAAGAAAAQEPPEQEAAALGEEIHVNLLRMPILARGRGNQPVRDLRPEDLEVKLAGRALEIAYLEPFIEKRTEEPLPDVRLHLELPGGGQEVVTSGEAEPGHIVFFIDVENDQKLGKPRAASQLARFVTTELDPTYRAAVLAFDGQIHVEQSFTADRRVVADAIRRAFDRPPRPQLDLRARIFQLVDNLEECVVERGAFVHRASEDCVRTLVLNYAAEQKLHADDYLVALEGLVRYVSGLQGRKSVVAVSHGISMNPAPELVEAVKAVIGPATEQLSLLEMELRTGEGVRFARNALIDLALENDVTLHFVDRTIEPAGDTSARLPHALQVGARPIHVAFTAPQWDLKEIAENTGGIFVSSADLFDGAKEIMDIEQGGYYLGVYTDHRVPRDELSKIRVRAQSRGVRILHQRGVYKRSEAEKLARDIRGRIALGRPYRAPSPERDRVRVPFQLALHARDIGYEVQRDAALTNFTVHFLVEDDASRRLVDAYHFVNHALPRAEWDAEALQPIVIDGWVELPVGAYRLVAVVRNPKLDKEGEIRQPLEVAPGSAAEATAEGR